MSVCVIQQREAQTVESSCRSEALDKVRTISRLLRSGAHEHLKRPARHNPWIVVLDGDHCHSLVPHLNDARLLGFRQLTNEVLNDLNMAGFESCEVDREVIRN